MCRLCKENSENSVVSFGYKVIRVRRMTNSQELWKVKDESKKNGVDIEIKDYTRKI